MIDGQIAKDTAQSGGFRSCAATHAGVKRQLNEDAFLNRPDIGLWAVADGAGGHSHGDVASTEVVDLLKAIGAGLSPPQMLAEVRSRLEAAHARLRSQGERQGNGGVVATTIVVLMAWNDHFACLWAGDSRAYLLRGKELIRITRDHSLVEDLIESGAISDVEAAHHPQANVITRAVGAQYEFLELDKRTGQLMAGDRLLLCTDGLSKTLSETQLIELLAGDDDGSAERLITAALSAQVSDNVTALTVDFRDVAAPAAPEPA